MPAAISAICNASVPLLTPTQCAAPQNSARRCSSSATSGPRMNWQCASTRSMRARKSSAMRRCCALRSRNGIGSAMACPSGFGAATRGRIVVEFGNQPRQLRQRELRLPAAARRRDLVERAADDRRIGGARCGHQQAGIDRRLRRLAAVEQLLEQLLAGTQSGETDLHVLLGPQSRQPHHLPREVDDLHRRTHVEHEDAALARAGQRVSGPPRSSWRWNSGTTEPVLPSTLPNRTVMQRIPPCVARAAMSSPWQYISASRLEAPITLDGFTALSVEISTIAVAPAARAASATCLVPTALVSSPSSGLSSTIGTCLSAAAWNTSAGR